MSDMRSRATAPAWRWNVTTPCPVAVEPPASYASNIGLAGQNDTVAEPSNVRRVFALAGYNGET